MEKSPKSKSPKLKSPRSKSPKSKSLKSKSLKSKSPKSKSPKSKSPKSKDIFSIFSKNRNEVLTIYNVGGSIVEFLANDSPICNLIGKDIILEKELGKGNFGTVYLINFPKLGLKNKFVVKELEINVEEEYVSNEYFSYDKIPSLSPYATQLTTEQIAEYLQDQFNPNIFIALNGGPNVMYELDDKIFIPEFARNCLQHEKSQFKKIDSPKEIIKIPANSYLCPNENYSEFMINLLVSETFFYSGSCINFIGVLDMITCTDKTKQYIFMEKIDTNFKIILSKEQSMTQNEFDGLMIQYFFAMACFQKFEIVHGDLHLENLFISEITDDMIWNGIKLSEVDYFEYEINGKSKYFPKGKYIIKIGDWGLACKYSSPMILNYSVMNGNYKNWIPNFYSSSYDILVTLFHLTIKYSKFLDKYLYIAFKNVIKSQGEKNIEKILAEYFNFKIVRPIIKYLDDYGIDPYSFLDNKELFENILVTPKSPFKSCKLGIINK